METNFALKKSRIESIEFKLPQVDKNVSIEFTFTFDLGINNDNPRLAKVGGILNVHFEENQDKNFFTITFSGIFEGDNDNNDLQFEDMETDEVNKMLIPLILEIDPIVQDVFMKSLGVNIDLGSSISDEKRPSES